MTEKELKLRAAIYTLMDATLNMPADAASFDPIQNDNDFFRMMMAGRIYFEREGDATVVAIDPVRRHEEQIIDGDVAGTARRAAVKLAANCLIEEPEVRFLAKHGIHAEPTPIERRGGGNASGGR